MSTTLVSCLKQVSLVTAAYFIGYYNFSVLWIIVPTIWISYKKQQAKKNVVRRDFYQSLNDHGEQQVFENFSFLPAWVFFPDFEKAEWVNRITQQLWPNVNHYAKDLIHDSIEPMLKKTLSGYQFKFDRINLGSQPLRVGGIKVYSLENRRDEIMMDLDVTYAGDCNITFYLLGFKCGIRNFELYGKLRVVFKPLVKVMPLVGGVQAYFMELPDINFDLFGTAQVLDIPGIKDTINKTVLDTIASMMVLPNKYFIQLTSESIKEATIERPQGVLRVHLLEAKDLLRKDFKLLKKGKSDPYAILRVGSQKCKSEIIDDTLDPKWDEWFEFKVSEMYGQILTVDLWDKDATDDEFLGSCKIDIDNVITSTEIDAWINLSQVKHGLIHLRLIWLPLSTNASDLENALTYVRQGTSNNINSSIITVVIDSASNIQCVKSNINPDPYVMVEVGKAKIITRVQEKTTTPIWEEGYSFFVRNPTIEKVTFTLIDEKTKSELGLFVYEIKDLLNLPNLEVVQQSFALKNGVKLVLSMYLKIYASKNTEPIVNKEKEQEQRKSISRTESMASRNSEKNNEKNGKAPLNKQDSTMSSASSIQSSDSTFNNALSNGRIYLTIRYTQQRQRLIVIVHRVENLRYSDPDDLPNVYVKLYLLPDKSKDSKRKTKILKNTVSPIFDDTLEYVIAQADLPNRKLEISVIADKVMKNLLLGQVTINLSNFDINTTITEWYDL